MSAAGRRPRPPEPPPPRVGVRLEARERTGADPRCARETAAARPQRAGTVGRFKVRRDVPLALFRSSGWPGRRHRAVRARARAAYVRTEEPQKCFAQRACRASLVACLFLPLPPQAQPPRPALPAVRWGRGPSTQGEAAIAHRQSTAARPQPTPLHPRLALSPTLAPRRFALLRFALLCFALLCFASLHFASRRTDGLAVQHREVGPRAADHGRDQAQDPAAQSPPGEGRVRGGLREGEGRTEGRR